MNRFETFRNEILKRAKEAAGACPGEYVRALNSENFSELIEVIKDNINYFLINKVIDEGLTVEYESEFEAEEVYCNKSTEKGLILAFGNASVSAWGDAAVRAFDNASVRAWGNALVMAWGNASVEARGNVLVRAWGNASVEARGNTYVVACGDAIVTARDNTYVETRGNATVRARDNSSVVAWENSSVGASGNASVTARDNAKVSARDNATVRAWGSAYIYSHSIIECKLTGNAIYRCEENNTIYYANERLNFEKS